MVGWGVCQDCILRKSPRSVYYYPSRKKHTIRFSNAKTKAYIQGSNKSTDETAPNAYELHGGTSSTLAMTHR